MAENTIDQLNIEINANASNASRAISRLAKNLDKLNGSVTNLNVSNLTSLSNAFKTLGNTNMGNVGRNLNNMARNSHKANNGFRKLSGTISKISGRFSVANKRSKGFVSTIGMFYAKFFLAIRAVKGLGKMIGSTQDYIEEFNYFTVALNKVGQDSKKAWKENGYNSAEEYAASFKTRFRKLQGQMTGYDVNASTGELTRTGDKNLGLNITEVMKYQAAIAQITNSSGVLGETSIATSKALSMLASDWSSLSNKELKDVQKNFQAGLVGQSRALYSYGIDITAAGLQATAATHGLDVQVKNLSQSAKMQLRALTMLEQSKVAYGDLARTLNQPANQLRMLNAGFANLGRSIGGLFMPLLEKMYPILNGVVLLLQEFVDWITKLAGIKLGDASISLPDYGDSAKDADKYADKTNKAAKATKKLSDNIQGFDVLNKLDDKDNSSSSSSNKGLSDLDLSVDIQKALANYEKIWNQAFKSNKNKAVQYAKKIKKALLDGWKKGGDYTAIGTALGNWISKGLSKINWSKINSNSQKIAKGFATFLNGLINGTDWGLVGETIANGLNTGVNFAFTFLTTFNFLNAGKSLATAINKIIGKFDAKKLGNLLGAKLRSAIQFAFGFITTFNFKNLGTKLSDAINGFLSYMGKVDKKTGLTGWQELGKSISDGISGFADTLMSALIGIDWDAVGIAIGEFLAEINWPKVLLKLAGVLASAISGIIRAAVSALANKPEGVISAVVGLFTIVFAYKKLAGVWGVVTSTFTKGLSASISQSAAAAGANKSLMGVMGNLGNILALAIAAGMGASWLGEKLAQWEQEANAEKNKHDVEKYHNTDKYKVDQGSQRVRQRWQELTGEKGTSAGLSKYLSEYDKEVGDKASNVPKADLKYLNKDYLLKYYKQYKKDKKKKDNVVDYEGPFTSQGSVFANGLDKLTKSMKKNKLSAKEQSAIIQTLQKAVDDGTLSEKEYNKIVNKTYKSRQQMNNILTTIASKTKPAKVGVGSLGKELASFRTKMANANIQAQVGEKYIEILTSKYEDGTLSLQDYLKILNSQFKTQKELNGEIEKIAGKEFAAKVNVKIENLKGITRQIYGYVKGAPSVPVLIKTVKFSSEAMESALKQVNKFFSKNPIQTRVAFSDDNLNTLVANANKGNKTAIARQNLDGTISISKAMKNDPDIKKLISYANSNKIKISYFASGGFPQTGQYFVARESGPELVGTMGGRTAVANNTQIESGITNAVAPAVYTATKEALKEVLTTANLGGGDVYLDGEKITTNVMSHAKKISNRRGTGWSLA